MEESKLVHIGLLTPHSGDRPHFHALRELLPQEVTLTIRGLNIAPGAPLEGRTAEVLRGVEELVQDDNVQGLILTGAPMSILNPEIERQLEGRVRIPLTIAVRATTAALKAMGAKKLILMTPFDAAMNLQVQSRLTGAGFAVLACPTLEHLGARTGTQVDPEEIFRMVEKVASEAPDADAIYFQGAPFDPLAIIDRIEAKLRLPVIASNPAMLWHILSLLGCRYSIKGYGMLLGSWPKIS